MDGKLRPDHICTVEHTGTSASAPLAAGMCALALEANPELTWRDMQFIVVLTSKTAPLEKENGWITNGIKRKVSHKFGYGLMDGEAMVSLAEQWSPVPPQHICKSQQINEERQIEAAYGSLLAVSMEVNACSGTLNEVRFLEHVQCKISLRFFPRGNLRITLTSPMGTTSTLLFERPRDVVSSNFDDWPFLSVHFWGEKVEGRWTLQIYNAGSRHVNRPGILQKWQLIFYGTATNPIRLRSPSQRSQQQKTTTFSFPSAAFRNLPNIFTDSEPPPGAAIGESMSSATGSQQDNDVTHVLHNCDPECDPQGCYGKGATQCVACKHYRLDNTCVSRCPPRSFANQDGVCWPCHESCETCAGAGLDSCLTCAPAHLRVTDLAVCLQICPDGYYENTEQGTCIPCEPNCASCQDRADHCSTCEHHLVIFENRCYAACPLYTYETDDYRCVACHSSCETCSGDGVAQCVTCRSGRLFLDGTCHAVCPDGYYGDKKRRECMTCPRGCATCNSATCLTCHAGYTLDKKARCVKQGTARCAPSEYFGETRCETCHATCNTCDGSLAGDCLTCASPLLLENATCVAACSRGFYADPTRAVCVPCLHACTQCVSRINCTACQPGLHLQSGQCRATCANGYYNDVGTCSKCYLSCMTCSGPRRDQCVTCPQGWQLAAGECHPECPQGFFMSQYGCQKCHHYCHTCKGEGPLQCTSCPPQSMLDGGLCLACLGSQYYDPPTQLCKACDSGCKTCSGAGPFSCLSCTFPLHLDKLNNQCVPCCTRQSQQNCCSCDKDTGECHNSSPAGKRRITVEHDIDEIQLQAASLRGEMPLQSNSPSTSFSSEFSLTQQLTSGNAIIVLCACALILMVAIVVSVQLKSESPGRGYSKIPLRIHNEGDDCLSKLQTDQQKALLDEETSCASEREDLLPNNVRFSPNQR
ncbi:furin-like protease 2 [Nilaparvata lugens]|uniref:furin-like protease 2 n=1 Tax=Nilaparvata lugens TaxID=108931 RepID=UPI00193E7836|nr:furin-like protease 2 [Nilaparvata lugens]